MKHVKSLVVLRHSLTRKGPNMRRPSTHLSDEGVRRARRLSERLPRFDYVAVGDQPRHEETALALGVAVDEQISWPSGYVDGMVDHHDQWSWSHPFVRYRELLRSRPELRAVVPVHLEHWRRMLGLVSEEGALLVVSSGGSIEPVLVAAVADGAHTTWGGPFHHLEGARLTWDGSTFTLGELLRQPPLTV